MKIPEDLAKHIISKGYSERFDKTFYFDDKEYHYFVNNSIFFAQMCRVYSLLAKKVGISAVEYNYIRINGKNLIYVPSINKSGESIYESDILPDNQDFRTYIDFFNIWKKVILSLPFKDEKSTMEEFYKQCFFGLLIYDVDKQISLVKDSNGLFRLGEYFDYGGVYMMQDPHEIDNDIFFDQESFEAFCNEREGDELYSSEKLQEDLELAIKRSVLNDIAWSDSQEKILKDILQNISAEFATHCFNIDILELVNSDDEHEYSDNFKKVLEIMYETSKKTLIEKIKEIINAPNDDDYKIRK